MCQTGRYDEKGLDVSASSLKTARITIVPILQRKSCPMVMKNIWIARTDGTVMAFDQSIGVILDPRLAAQVYFVMHKP